MSVQLQPDQFLRRSPLYRQHQQLGASFMPVDDGAGVAVYDQSGELTSRQKINREATQAQSMALVDLTLVPRVGFKGKGTIAWMQSLAIAVPERPNLACESSDGVTVARLSDTELLLLGNPHKQSKELTKLEQTWSLNMPEFTYLLPRADSHCCLALCGEHVPEMLSKVCAVDMRLHKFAQHSVAQTSVARVNSIVVRADQGTTPNFYLFTDLSSCEFMWQGLLDAMAEFDGQPVGMKAFLKLAKASK